MNQWGFPGGDGTGETIGAIAPENNALPSAPSIGEAIALSVTVENTGETITAISSDGVQCVYTVWEWLEATGFEFSIAGNMLRWIWRSAS